MRQQHLRRLTAHVCETIPGKPYRLAYAEDPFGDALEVLTHSFAEAWANWPQPGMHWETTLLNRDGTETPMSQR